MNDGNLAAFPGFREELFVRRVLSEEGPLRDRKREIPDLLRNDKNKAEFIKDVISLANSARAWGRTAYMLFGLDDSGSLFDISPSLGLYREKAEKKGMGRDWDEARFEECLWQEIIRRSMLLDLIANYVDPNLAGRCSLEHGSVRGHLCAYLKIPAAYSETCYCVKRELKSRDDTLLRSGQCWIRVGESKREVSEQERPHCYGAWQVPHPFPEDWRRYFSMITDEFHNTTLIAGYQDLFTVGHESLEGVVREFLSDATGRVLVIQGKAGIGKTAFLKRLIYELASDGEEEMRQTLDLEQFLPPSSLVPLYFPLRGWEPGDDALDREVGYHLFGDGFLCNQTVDLPEKLLDCRDLRVLICFDGLDEIWTLDDRGFFLKALLRLERRHPSVKVILTTRPDLTVPDLRGHATVTLDVLGPAQIRGYLRARAAADWYDEACEFLQSEPDLWELCGTPAFLEAAVCTWFDEISAPASDLTSAFQSVPVEPTATDVVRSDDAVDVEGIRDMVRAIGLDQALSTDSEGHQGRQHEREREHATEPEASAINDCDRIPIQKGRVLDRVYRRIWQRECCRMPLAAHEPGEWFDNTGELAASMDGRKKCVQRKEALRLLTSEKGLNWVLGLGVLEAKPRTGRIHFVSHVTRSYFAARFLLPFVEEGELETPTEYIAQGQRWFWERTLSLLADICYVDIAPLEKLLENL